MISFDTLSWKVNLEFNLFLILKTTLKLTKGRMSWTVFSKVYIAESSNFLKLGRKKYLSRTVCRGTFLE